MHDKTYKEVGCSKVPYASRALARVEIKTQHSQHVRFNKKYNNRKNNLKVHCYECPRCGKWHLTTQKQKKKY